MAETASLREGQRVSRRKWAFQEAFHSGVQGDGMAGAGIRETQQVHVHTVRAAGARPGSLCRQTERSPGVGCWLDHPRTLHSSDFFHLDFLSSKGTHSSNKTNYGRNRIYVGLFVFKAMSG